MASRAPPTDQYRPGPVPGSWVYLRTDPSAAKVVEESVPLEVQLTTQLIISDKPGKTAKKIPAQTFNSFEALATELRFQIWGYLLPDARVVEFEPVGKKPRENIISCYSLYPKLASKFNQKSLGVLPYACHDSRAFFLDKYHLSFDSFLRNPIYFSPKYDVLLFSNEYALMLFTDALGLIPWAEARASVAPVRKAAIRWTFQPGQLGSEPKTHLALQDTPIANGYKLKLRVLLERLTTLEKFAFLYLFRSIDEDPKADMVNFVEGLEEQMNERKEMAKKEGKKNTNIPLTPWADHVPELVMLQCPTGIALQNEVERHGLNDDWDEWGEETWELGTREWACSRLEPDYKPLLSDEENLDDSHTNPPIYDPYGPFFHQYHQHRQFHQHHHY